jgi:hypothetical protein
LEPDTLSDKGDKFLHQSLQTQKYVREKSGKEKASTGSTTHIIRRSCGSRNLKRSTRCPRLLQMLGGMNRGTLLRRDFWWLNHHSLLLRGLLCDSQSIQERISWSIPPRIIIVTKKGKNLASTKRERTKDIKI